ncbi:MAG TPA: ABC transporter substrate-binding protein [Cytophagales bacterium]|nr:ABC transporter substrate-binding protein [Cytophagales bacterium]HAP64005.1 ABC transporter substrate-binding protein [Cytophagales bacterium]
MKVCSFLPAVTQMIYDMGLQDRLHGVTFECPSPALQEKQKVVRCVLEGKTYTSQEIDTIFSQSKAEGRSLYYVDEPVLQAINPDVIFTQDVCEVCQIDTACTSAAVAKLDKEVELVPISPDSLRDVFDSLVTIAKVMGAEENAYVHLQHLTQRLDTIVDTLRAHRAPLRRVSLLEWVDPIYNCGHWIPDQIAHAGGVDMLSNPSGDSIVTSWEKILRYNPEVLVIAPCGYHTDRTQQDMYFLTAQPGWEDLAAVKQGQVYLVDFDLFTQPSASTLVEGIEMLAALFHPELFSVPEPLKTKTVYFQPQGTPTI